jgi:hypothetical protein
VEQAAAAAASLDEQARNLARIVSVFDTGHGQSAPALPHRPAPYRLAA